MNFDPDVQKYLAAMHVGNPPQFYQLDVPAARAVYQQLGEKFGGPVIEMAAVEGRQAGGAVGKLPIRIYRPHGLARGAAPTLVYFHGGGWTIGSIQTHDKVCRRIGDQAKCVVISIEYRLAPEYPMPAGAEGAMRASTYKSFPSFLWRFHFQPA